LTAEFGKGFSQSNLQNMRSFYMNYEKLKLATNEIEITNLKILLRIHMYLSFLGYLKSYRGS